MAPETLFFFLGALFSAASGMLPTASQPIAITNALACYPTHECRCIHY